MPTRYALVIEEGLDERPDGTLKFGVLDTQQGTVIAVFMHPLSAKQYCTLLEQEIQNASSVQRETNATIH